MASAPPQFQEGQRVRGRNGEIAVIRNGVPVVEQPVVPQPMTVGTPNPQQPYDTRRAAAGAARDEYGAANAPVETRFDRESSLRQQFDQRPEVRAYREVLPLYVSASRAEDTRAGDLNLIYAFGKMMDPGSVVREGEMVMVQGSSPIAQRLQAIFDSEINSTGRINAATRRQLLSELSSRRHQLAESYNRARNQFLGAAREYGLDPTRVVGDHPAQGWLNEERERQSDASDGGMVSGREMPRANLSTEQQRLYDAFLAGNPRATADDLRTFAREAGLGEIQNADNIIEARNEGAGVRPASEALLQPAETPGSSALSGIYRGLSKVVGAPVDITNSLLGTVGLGADRPIGGSERGQSGLMALGYVQPESQDPTNRFISRVGQSVGSAAVPLGGAYALSARELAALGQAAPSLASTGSGFLMAAGGGAGAAEAQRLFPGNPWAEMGGELLGSAATGGGLYGLASRNARQAAEAAVPTTGQLRSQASNLYDQAESRGVVAGPNVTTNLAGRVRDIATDNALITPTGRVSTDYPRAAEAMRLLDDFAGQQMDVRNIQVVRDTLADAVQATAGKERRIARMMLNAFDEETGPLAPELASARRVSSRYLQADQIDQARQMAEPRATQFSRGGEDNALRTDFRALERDIIQGEASFPPAVEDAIRNVVRGGPVRNATRWIGGLAPSTTGGNIVPGLGIGAGAGAMTGDPVLGALIGAGTWGAGTAGRVATNALARRDMEVAHLLARAGGDIPVDPVINPALRRQIALSLAGQIYGAGEGE